MREHVLTPMQRFLKRTMDLSIAVPGLILTSPVIAVAVAVATLDTRKWGIFTQKRIGRWGQPFTVYKIRTMRSDLALTSTSTSSADPRITRSGRILRRLKVDELPQLYNVVRGDMSLVGPRPDVAGFADRLEGNDRIVLTVRPGITSPATLYYANEEDLLAQAPNSQEYATDVLWPIKVRMNRQYVERFRLSNDARIIAATLRLLRSTRGPEQDA